MTNIETQIPTSLASIRARMDAALARRPAAVTGAIAGAPVRLIGVSKRQGLAKIEAAHAAGLRDFGENYAQELRDKLRDWPSERGDPPRWHYIGAIQSNKLKYMVGRVALIHTVDRAELILAIDKRAAQTMGVVQEFLIEVDLGGEAQKAGVPPAQVPALLDVCADTPHARCVGLMIIPPAGEPEQTRRYFRELRELLVDLRAQPRPNVELRELSMGMSADFEVAIEEGATLVRVGTAIFGART